MEHFVQTVILVGLILILVGLMLQRLSQFGGEPARCEKVGQTVYCTPDLEALEEIERFLAQVTS